MFLWGSGRGGVYTPTEIVLSPGVDGVHMIWTCVLAPRARKNATAGLLAPVSLNSTAVAPFASFVPSLWIVIVIGVGLSSITIPVAMSVEPMLRSGQTWRV